MKIALQLNGQPVEVELLERTAQEVRFRLQGKTYRFTGQKLRDGSWLIDEETAPGSWRRRGGTLWNAGRNTTRVQSGAQEARISEARAGTSENGGASALSPTAPMPGMVRRILVKKGAAVKEGDALCVLEAMKLQLTLSAGGDAVVREILVKEGEMVAEGAELVRLEAKTQKKKV